jgi:hypothetical protein
MPVPTATQVTAAASSTSWLDDAPGGDIPFDQLFGTEPEASASSNPNPQTQTTVPDVQPVVTDSQQPAQTFQEIKTSTGSVYKTYEAVTKGIEDKDTLIQQLRERYKAVTGQDPIKPVPEPERESYLQNPTKFAGDLAEAAKNGDAPKYQKALLGLMDEYLGPVKPLFQDFARSRAQAQVSSEFKEYDTFRNGSEYNKVLERNPILANAIQGAEQDFRYSSQLPELYRLAYESYTSRRMPELVQAAQTTAATTTQTARPATVQSSTLAPTNPVTQKSEAELLRTPEGRKELIARFKAQGLDDQPW